MSSLIDLKVTQGSVIRFGSSCTKGTAAFSEVEKMFSHGRFGYTQKKQVIPDNLFVVLSQDCSISSCNESYIELAQLKFKESAPEHLLQGKDYKKLYVNYFDSFYEIEESLLTKVKKADLKKHIENTALEVSRPFDDHQKRILLDWRILTYLRVPFPDKFNKALVTYFRDSENWFPIYLRDNNKYIHSIRVFVSPKDEEDAEHYHFSITVLLYDLQSEDNINGLVPESFKNELDDKLEKMLKEFSEPSFLTCTQLDSFDYNSFDLPRNYTIDLSISVDDFTFANANIMKEFNFQYLCY